MGGVRGGLLALALALASALALILSACAETPAPDATHTPTAITSTAPTETVAPPDTPTPIPPTTSPNLSTSSQPQQPLNAWSIAADNSAVYIVDANSQLYELTPIGLETQTQSQPLFDAATPAETDLAVDETYLFVGNTAISQTLVLKRSDFSPVTTLNQAGPMAVDPNQRLFMIFDKAIWAFSLSDLAEPPQRLDYENAYDPERGFGAIPRHLTINPANRTLYVTTYDAFGSPPHNPDSYRAFNLDDLSYQFRFNGQLGQLSPPAVAPETGNMVSTLAAKNGFLGNKLLILAKNGEELATQPYLNGLPVTDSAGEWIYLLRERGLWVLQADDLSLRGIFPFDKPAPAGLALSPDDGFLFLFGNGWLNNFKTFGLQTIMGFPTLNEIPPFWLTASPNTPNEYPARLYYSPQYEQDQTAFLQLTPYAVYNPYNNTTAETWRTTNGGESWTLLLNLSYPTFAGVQQFSLSPQFATDRTLTARTWDSLLRSTNAGETWETFSPPIAFTSNRDGDNNIYLMDQNGENPRPLTTDPADDETPAWSPAWTRLAFASNRNGNWDIYVCTPPSFEGEAGRGCNNLQQLTTSSADELLPAWSPDGGSIAFVSMRDGNPEIYLMNADGSNQRRLTFNPGGDWRPAWHPGNQSLYFTSDRAGNNDIYRLTLPQTDEPLNVEPDIVQITTHPADDRDPAINAQGKLAFLSDRDGFKQSYTLDLNSPYAQPVPFAAAQHPEAHPAWVDDAASFSLLIALEDETSSNIYQAAYPEDYLPLTATSGFNGHPAWGPVWWSPLGAPAIPAK